MAGDANGRNARSAKVIIEHDARLSILEKYGIYKSVNDLKNAQAGDLPYTLILNNVISHYQYVEGNFAGKGDDVNTIILNKINPNIGALRKIDGTLYAGNFGVVGDGITDDTNAVQSFVNFCQATRRTAYFGSLVCKVTKTIYLVNSSMVFDVASYAGGPGLHPVYNPSAPNAFKDGVVNLSGICHDFCATITGEGEATQNSNGAVTGDTRTPINGFQFGNEAGSARDTLILSRIRWARAWKLSGTGVRVINCFDTRFGALSTELCGNETNFAFTVEDGNNTTNECVFEYIQCEQSVVKGLFISPNTLSTTFTKIHAERLDGKVGIDGFCLGCGDYSSVRISSRNGKGGAIWTAQSASVSQARVEDLVMKVDSSGGSITFTECSGVYTPSTDSNGSVNFIGGVTNLVSISTGWTITGGRHTVSIGFCVDNLPVNISSAEITTLTQSNDKAQVVLDNCRVNALYGGKWTNLSMTTMTRAVIAGGLLDFSYGYMAVDANVRIVGDISTDTAGVRFNGILQGNYATRNSRQILWGPQAEVTGVVTNSADKPEAGDYLGGFLEGMYSKNIRPTILGISGSEYFIQSWSYVAGSWRECRVPIIPN